MKDLLWLKNELIAHRGLHSKDQKIPENSILSFKHAITSGYAIECDVNITKDGIPIVFHDITLKRLCGDDRRVDEVTYEELATMKLSQSKESIPTLLQTLDFVNNQVPLLIELKPKGNVIKLCQSVSRILSQYKGRYAIFSFHPKVVYWFKKNQPDIIRGQIAESFRYEKKMNSVVRWMMKNMVFNALTKPDFISYGVQDLPNKKLDRLKKKGITIISYAAENQDQFDLVKKYYDNVVFEYFIPKIKG